jgi:hypothetical protein
MRYPTVGEHSALAAAVEGVQRIRTWAALEAGRLSRDSPSKALREETRAAPRRTTTTFFIGRLADLYPRFFGKPFKVSKLALPTRDGRPAGEVGGPGIHFIKACLAQLGISMNAEAIEKAWDAYRGDKRNGRRE